jgi:hypothetical protein
MVRTVFILLWDYNYRRGLSDDICLFSAPIPTSTFMRVVLCIHGMACHDMTWPRLSIRWKRGAYSSHLMCRQRATRNRAAMRAAYLVLMALGEDKMSLQSLECLLCHVWHFCPFDSLSSLLRTDRFLGDARFDLQINNIPRGSEDTVYGNGLFF